jgi:tripartite-type tricarboxylate transporter receptor subunit TctC
LIVAYPPGGGTDVIARIVAQKMSDGLGKQLVVDNRGGADTIIGTDLVAKATPDGYTIGMATSTLTINTALYPKLPYNVTRDLAPATLQVKGLYVLVVHPSVPAKSMGELIELIKSSPGKYNAANAGPGSPSHLGLAQINAHQGLKVVGINYKGAGPAASSVLSGETQIMVVSMPTVIQQIQAGRLRALAVTTTKRSPSVPDLPTAAEAGLPGFEASNWYGLIVPTGTPKSYVTRLHEESRKALADPTVKQRLLELGADIVSSTPEEFAVFIRAEITKWAKLLGDTAGKQE